MSGVFLLVSLVIVGVIFGQWLVIWFEQWRFKRLARDQISLAVVFGSLGQGKSLLFSWLVNRLAITYTNFWHKKKDNQILKLDFLNVRGSCQIPTERAYYFVDEVNLSFRGVEYQKNQRLYPGIEDFCALARHFDKTVFFSVQRPNQLWNVIREIANIYIKVQGIHTPFFLPWCKVLKIEVYEDLQLAEAWAANMEPYQKKSGFFSLWSDSDYTEAKKRLNIRNFRLFLKSKDFKSYDTKFFKALLPILNRNRPKVEVPAGKIPVPKTLRDIIKEEYFEVSTSEKTQPRKKRKLRKFLLLKSRLGKKITSGWKFLSGKLQRRKRKKKPGSRNS